MIREILSEKQLSDSVAVIRNSFQTAADRFGLTRDNCPSHPSFITMEKIIELKKRGPSFFGYYTGDLQVGFIAVEKASGERYYLEKISVLPEHRHNSYGIRLVEFGIDYIVGNNGKMVSIGVIDADTALKGWYNSLGFRETLTKKYSHLPFTVCFMEKKI